MARAARGPVAQGGALNQLLTRLMPAKAAELAGKGLQSHEELWNKLTPWVAANVLHLERPGGWHCVMNFGSDPAPLPEGQLLLSSGTAPVVDQLPGETTVWLTRPRPA